MLEKIFDSSGSGLVRVRLLREGLHGPLLDSYSGQLLHCRYANITARRHLRSAEHFAYWASHHAMAVSQWNDSLLERFRRHLRQRRCSYGHSQPLQQLTGASLFLEHLRSNCIIDSLPADPDRPAMLVAFRRWMYEQRGTQDGTLDNYDVPIRILLEHLGDAPERLNAQRLRQCFLKYTDGKNHASIKHAATALRMFVRFLITEGRCPPGLEGGYSSYPALAALIAAAIPST
jgi:integrase/recombinase XerD